MIDHNTYNNKIAAYLTLGCKLNFAETSAIGKLLHDMGIRKARQGETADICIINTCSVTDLADKKCRQAIRRMIKEHPNAFVIVTGCYAQLKPEDIASIEGVDLVLGAEQKSDIVSHLDNLKKNDVGAIFTTHTNDIKLFTPSCSADDRTRYFLKVQDGCDYFCSYCTIPFARGRSRNGTIASLVEQAREVAAKGGKEIVLTGVNIGDFGKTTGETFFDLIKALDDVEGIVRYRISSIEPNLLTDEMIDFVALSKRFAPHYHLPLHSGSDNVLLLMKRKYDTALFKHKIEKIKAVLPDAFIGVDVIVGTRGETDEYFEDSLRFIESLDVSQLHVFTYSERPGTQALRITHEVDTRTKHIRCRRLLDISDQKLADFYLSQQGTTHRVLFEHTKHDRKMYGFTENYIKVERDYDSLRANTTEEVVLGSFNNEKTALILFNHA
jgi:threonylcarbamoyladenosine tRNA methylthiotransferase MtaB